MKIIFISHANKTHLHMKGFALGLVLRVRVFETRKWPIVALSEIDRIGSMPMACRKCTFLPQVPLNEKQCK